MGKIKFHLWRINGAWSHGLQILNLTSNCFFGVIKFTEGRVLCIDFQLIETYLRVSACTKQVD